MRCCRIRAWLILVTALALVLSIGPAAESQQKGGIEIATESPLSSDQAKPDVGVANAKHVVADTDSLLVLGHLNSGVALSSSEVCGRDDVQDVVEAEFFRDPAKQIGIEVVGLQGTERSQTEEKPSGEQGEERALEGRCFSGLDCRGSFSLMQRYFCERAPGKCSFHWGGRCTNFSAKPGCQ